MTLPIQNHPAAAAGLTAAAREACIALVDHYSDPTHYTSPLPSEGCDHAASTEFRSVNNYLSAPYFDGTLGCPMLELKPPCLGWNQQLRDASSAIDNNTINNAFDVVNALLRCYESVIHPCVKRKQIAEAQNDVIDRQLEQPGIPLHAVIEIVSNYELLIAHAMRDGATLLSADGSTQICDANNNQKELYMGTASKSIPIIADDIFRLSTQLPKKSKNESTFWKVRNVLLPCLLRLIEHSVVLLTLRSYQHNLSNPATNATGIKNALAIATVVAVPFVGDGKLNSGAYGIGSLLDWIQDRDKEGETPMPYILSLAYTLQHCSIPPKKSFTLSQSIMSSNFMQRSVVDFSVPSARVSASWTDGVTGIGFRSGMNLLRAIHHSSSRILAISFSEGIEENLSPDLDRSRYLRQLLCNISQNIGTDVLVSCIRAHFFGRLVEWGSRLICDTTLVRQPQTRGIILPMIQRSTGSISKTSASGVASLNAAEKPHIRMPMRLSAAAILLCSVIFQPCNFTMWDTVSSDTLPIALTLLDDVQSVHLAIGALILISTIDAASSFHSDVTPSIVTNLSSLLPRTFEGAIHMVIREEPAFLTSICLAQSKWITFLCSQHSHISEIRQSNYSVLAMARKAAAELLVAMGKQARIGGRDGNDERIAGAFVAGVNPLLALLATFPEAASIEIARVGLSAILPLIGWSGMSLEVRSAQVAGLAGMISLMNGAYPIMPHHGQKIMTELFLLLDRAQKDTEFVINSEDGVATDVTSKVAFHAAGIVLILCGKSAESILGHIEMTKSSMERIINRCHQIRAASEQLKGSV